MLALITGRDPSADHYQGDTAYVRAHARAALAAGYEPHVLCLARRAGTLETDYGVIHRIASPFRPMRQLMIWGHWPLLTRALVNLAARRPGPVLAHGFGVWSYAGVRACARLREQGTAATAIVSSYTTHRVESESQVRGATSEPVRARLSFGAQALWARLVVQRFERLAYREAAAVFVNYDSVRRMIVATHGPNVRVRELPYSPEVDFLPPPPAPRRAPAAVKRLKPAAAPLVVCIGSHHPRKGIDVLIDALALARDRGTTIRACLIGGGPLLAAHRRRADALGLSGSVAVLGRVQETEGYLDAADIFALPSREEQSGSLALLESLRAGLPSITTTSGGIPEDVTDGESALLVEPGDAAELATALERLAADAALRARIAAGGRRTFERRFSAEPFSAALAAAYAEHGVGPP
jgi:glycosyltransferase involved in cell wall biosynthesis